MKKILFYPKDVFFLSTLEWFAPIIYLLKKKYKVYLLVESKIYFERYIKNYFFFKILKDKNIKVIFIKKENKDYNFTLKSKLKEKMPLIYILLQRIYFKYLPRKKSKPSNSLFNEYDLIITQYLNNFSFESIKHKVVYIPQSVEILNSQIMDEINLNKNFNLFILNSKKCVDSFNKKFGMNQKFVSYGIPRIDLFWINLINKYLKKNKEFNKIKKDKRLKFIFYSRKPHPSTSEIERISLYHKIFSEILKDNNKLLIIKPHPNESKYLLEDIANKINKNFIITNLPSTALLNISDNIVISKSAIGIELILQGKKVLQFLTESDRKNKNTLKLKNLNLNITVKKFKNFSNYFEKKYIFTNKKKHLMTFFDKSENNSSKKILKRLEQII